MRLSTALSQPAFGTLQGQPGEAKTASTISPHFDFGYCFRDRNDLAQAGAEQSLCSANCLEFAPSPTNPLASSSQVLTLQVCVTWSH